MLMLKIFFEDLLLTPPHTYIYLLIVFKEIPSTILTKSGGAIAPLLPVAMPLITHTTGRKDWRMIIIANLLWSSSGVVEGGSGGLSPLLKVMRVEEAEPPILQTSFRLDKFITMHFPKEMKGKVRFYQ